MLGGSKSFDNRVRLIQSAHAGAKHNRGFVVGKNGVLSVKKRRRSFNFPIKGLLYLALGFVVFKAIAMAQAGLPTYVEKVQLLEQGTVFEQAGATVLRPDPVSTMIAAQIAPYLR